MKHAYLLHTGYGKTKLMLDKIMSMPSRPKVLLLSTKKVIESAWAEEIDKWYPNQITYRFITGDVSIKDRQVIIDKTDTDILGLNTEMLDWYISNTLAVKSRRTNKKGVSITYRTDELINRFDMVIIDESSLFKSYNSKRFKTLKSWCSDVKDVFILSATPSPKNIENLWSQIYLLDGGQRLGKNITAFRNAYAIPVRMSNGFTRYEYTQKSIDYVLSLIKDIVTSVPAPAQPLFPEPILRKVLIKPNEETLEQLTTFKKNFMLTVEYKNIVAFSKQQLMSKISQLASGALYNNNLTYYMNDIKMRILMKQLSEITTPVMVVYHYVFNKEQLLKIPGAVLLDNPQAFKDWNNNKIKVGILSPYSTAHGLNLQQSDCQDIIWFSPIWDTEKWIQTNARVCRRGQTRQVLIRVLLLKESFDEYAFDLVMDKFNVQYNNLQKLR